jgi:hypothetical protein
LLPFDSELELKALKAEDFAEKLKNMEVVHGELTAQLQAERQLRAVLGAHQSETLDEATIPKHKENLNEFFDFWRKAMDVPSKSAYLVLNVPNGRLDLNTLLDTYYEDVHYKMLFSHPLTSKPGTNVKRVVGRWKAKFQNNKQLNIETAEDEGGPSQQFFSDVWKQLDGVKVNAVKLFTSGPGGLVPVDDESLEYKLKHNKSDLERVRAYFHCIGVFLCHCLHLSKTNFGPIKIPEHVLPPLYQQCKCSFAIHCIAAATSIRGLPTKLFL